MLVIDPAVRAAHARPDLNAGLRYAVVRLAELLDPRTPFALSASSYCDPVAAAGAFESAARDHLANPGVRFGTVLAASQLLSDALDQEGNLRTWYPGDLTRLLLFVAQLRKVPALKTVGERQVKVPYHERTTWVRQKLGALADGSLARFRAAIEDPESGYRARLLDQLARRLCAPPAAERGWAELEHDLCYTAALLLGDGRDGRELARAVASAVAAAPDAEAAAAALREIGTAAPSAYQVAVVLSGAGSLDAGRAAGLGAGVIERERPAWETAPSRPPRAADRALRAFVTRCAAPGGAIPLLLRVEAWDAEQARVRALLAAEALHDHLVAEHPHARLTLEREALVLDVACGTVRRSGEPGPPIRGGRAAHPDSAPGLRPFLRANALARGQRSPGLGVLHAWIALECLARDGAGAEHAERPALSLKLESYLPPHLGSAAAVAGLRAMLLTSWDEARALALRSPHRADWLVLERRLGVAGGRPRSLTRLVALLRALPGLPSPPEGEGQGGGDAGEDLARLLSAIGPFPARRLADLGRRFGKGSRLAKLAEGIQVRSAIVIARLKLARHFAVHRGLDAAGATPALALGAVALLDSALEVLRLWLEPDGQPPDAMAAGRRWHERNLSHWRTAGDLELDADHLLHP